MPWYDSIVGEAKLDWEALKYFPGEVSKTIGGYASSTETAAANAWGDIVHEAGIEYDTFANLPGATASVVKQYAAPVVEAAQQTTDFTRQIKWIIWAGVGIYALVLFSPALFEGSRTVAAGTRKIRRRLS